MGLPVVEEAPKTEGQMPGTDMPHDAEKHMVAANLKNVRRKIGVHSGKGGVGKTFIAVNLALALVNAQKKVGLLDADIDCPNVAKFLNLRNVPLEGSADGRMSPLEHRGLKIVSTHFLTDSPNNPMIVRGPIKHKVLAELLSRVNWGSLDVLITDLPPGTADVPMSSMMIGNMDGMIIVTSPQKEAILDTRKSAIMARDLNVPVLGIIENMSGDVFGTGTGAALARDLEVPFLGTIPLAKGIRVCNEAGKAALVENEAYSVVVENLMKVACGEKLTIQRSLWNKLLSR